MPKLESDATPRVRGAPPKYPFLKMEVGDELEFADAEQAGRAIKTARCRSQYHRVAHGKHIRFERQGKKIVRVE
jgi:hypothetical protein